MRRESADFIGVRSGRTGRNKAGYKATILSVKSEHTTLAQTGGVHIIPNDLDVFSMLAVFIAEPC
jgi:hypothetical protein